MFFSPCLLSDSPQFQLGDVCQFAAHQENGRLMGFVVESTDWTDGDEEGETSFSAFVFESNTEGEKVDATNSSIFLMKKLVKWCTNPLLKFIFFVFIDRYVTP